MARSSFPTQFGKFYIEKALGVGGMAEVYRARDTETGQIVALKLIKEAKAHRDDLIEQFQTQEIGAAVLLDHPNIVKIYESGDVQGRHYYTMEYVRGRPLSQYLKKGPLPLRAAIRVLRQVTSGLVEAHKVGIVHRDIKPSNIMLTSSEDGRSIVKIADFGLARMTSEPTGTAQGHVVGTPRYMSPEQIRGEPLDGRADIYSLGVVAYEMITGHPPFETKTPQDVLRANLQQEPRPMTTFDPGCREEVQDLIHQMLAKDREDRYDAEGLLRDLDRLDEALLDDSRIVETEDHTSAFYIEPGLLRRRESLKRLLWPWGTVTVLVVVIAVLLLLLLLR